MGDRPVHYLYMHGIKQSKIVCISNTVGIQPTTAALAQSTSLRVFG